MGDRAPRVGEGSLRGVSEPVTPPPSSPLAFERDEAQLPAFPALPRPPVAHAVAIPARGVSNGSRFDGRGAGNGGKLDGPWMQNAWKSVRAMERKWQRLREERGDAVHSALQQATALISEVLDLTPLRARTRPADVSLLPGKNTRATRGSEEQRRPRGV
jgi:hypothetical protein